MSLPYVAETGKSMGGQSFTALAFSLLFILPPALFFLALLCFVDLLTAITIGWSSLRSVSLRFSCLVSLSSEVSLAFVFSISNNISLLFRSGGFAPLSLHRVHTRRPRIHIGQRTADRDIVSV